MATETRYARSGDVSIAYQTFGHGAFDLVLVPGFLSNLEIQSEDPGHALLQRRLAAFSRLIQFDKRGAGLSDRIGVNRLPDLETRMDDIRAVMDAAGSGRAALLGVAEGAAMSILFSVAYPERTRALVLYGGYAHFHNSVLTPAALETLIAGIGKAWGSGATLPGFAPGLAADPQFSKWWARLERLSASPSAAAALWRMNAAIDVRGLLGKVRAPTLVVHRAGDPHVDPEAGRYLARHIPGATLVELPGGDHPIWTGDVGRVADVVEQFLTGAQPRPQTDRVLAALLSGRIVRPERIAARLGDSAWRERSGQFRDVADAACRRQGGAIWSWDGERVSARFDGPAKAVRAAAELRSAAVRLALDLAQGVHVGEIETGPDRIAGLAIHVADRIADRAEPGTILASALLAELAAGSGIHFTGRPDAALDGMQGRIQLVAVETEQHLEPASRYPGEPDLSLLSAREQEVLGLVAEGLSNGSIAARLRLSDHTVKRHVANILLKLDLPTRAAAAALAARQPAQ